MVHLVLLSTHCVDSSPCVVLVTENNRILFDVGEGTQRLCVEHGIKLAKMNDVFLTRFSTECVGGLPGLCLTMAEVVKDEVRLHGPDKLGAFLHATQRFMKIVRFKVPEYEGLASSKHLCDDVTIHALRFSNNGNACTHLCYVGETAVIKGKFDVEKAAQLKVPKGPLYGKLKNGETITLPTGEVIEPSQVLGDAEPPRFFIIVCNIADCPEVLLNSFVDDPMLKRFGATGDLRNQLECIIHLSPSDILSSTSYTKWVGDSFAASVQHISAYHGRSAFQAAALHTTKLYKVCPSFFGDLSPLSSLSGPPESILKRPSSDTVPWYRQGQPLMKIVLSPSHKRCFEEAPAVTVAADADEFYSEALRLNPDLPADLNKLAFLTRAIDQNTTDSAIASQFGLNLSGARQLRSHSENRLLFLGTGCAVPSKYRNVSGILLQFSSTRSCMLIDVGEGTWQQLLKMARLTPALFPFQHSSSSSGDNFLTDEDCSTLAAAMQLKLAWISHPHADHHLGLITVILQRRAVILRHCPALFKPLVVIASTAVLLFLHDCCSLLPGLSEGYIGASCRQFDPLDACDLTDAYYDVLNEIRKMTETSAAATIEMDVDPTAERPADKPLVHPARRRRNDPITDQSPCWQHMTQSLAAARECFASVGLSRLQNVPVAHCSQSYGLILESTQRSSSESGVASSSGNAETDCFKLVYSGDTRPCTNLIQFGRNASILIHEGTFEDDKWDEAVVKKHSTIGEALDAAHSMSAYRVILTHFSQRYPSMPMIDAPSSIPTATGGDVTGLEGSRYGRLVSREDVKFVVAFDYMQVSFGQLLWAPAVVPVLEKAFPSTPTGGDDDEQSELAQPAGATVCTCASGSCVGGLRDGQLCGVVAVAATATSSKKAGKKDLKRKAQNQL